MSYIFKIQRKKVMKYEGDFDFEHLKKIHQYLFQDLYHWAGKIRTCDIAKRDLCCLSQYIESYVEDVFKVFVKNNYFISMQYDEKIAVLTSFFGDINALHPFRECKHSKRVY